jgi:alkylhydroperoxidase family enzyme
MQMNKSNKGTKSNSLKPLEPPYSQEVGELFERYPKREGYILRLFRVFANSERFLKKGTVNLLDRESPLSMRQRELVILRVTANNNCEYEWGVHVAAFGAHIEFGEVEIDATRHGDHLTACWEATESLLVEVVDELCASGTLNDCLVQRFQANFSKEQQLEVMALCGNYHTVSFVANVSRVALEDFSARFT